MKITVVCADGTYQMVDDKFIYEIRVASDGTVEYFSLVRQERGLNARDLKNVRLGECLELIAAYQRGEINV